MRGHCSKLCSRKQEASHQTCPHLNWDFPNCTALTVNVKSLSHLGYGVCFACMWSPGVIGVLSEVFCFVLFCLGQGLSLAWDSANQLKRPTDRSTQALTACLCLVRPRISYTSVHVPPYLAFVTGPRDHTLVLMHPELLSGLRSSSLNMAAVNRLSLAGLYC